MARVLEVAVVLSLWLCAAADQPYLCMDSSHTGGKNCECLDGSIYVVSCSNFDLTELPLKIADNYSSPWAGDFDDNKISKVSAIPTQEKMVVLSLSYNSISTIDDRAFSDLVSLRILNLSHCDLDKESLTVDAFEGPANQNDTHNPLMLTELDLSHNKIEGLNSHAFSHLMHLKTLFMSDNPLHDLSLSTITAFNELTYLETLDLSRCKLARIPDQFFAGMRHLKSVILSGNNFETIPYDVNFAKSLLRLNLDYNPIKKISGSGDSGFAKPIPLEELSMSHMPSLKRVENLAFGKLSNLTKLFLHDNPKLENIERLAFVGDSTTIQLKELYLQNNELKTLQEHLVSWETLEKLNLQYNPWHCDCYMQWMVEHPVKDTKVFSNPEYTQYIVCASPPEATGRAITALSTDKYEFECSEHQDVHASSSSYYAPIIIMTIFIGTFLLVSATILFAFVLFQRIKGNSMSSTKVRYRRAQHNDLGSITQNI